MQQRTIYLCGKKENNCFLSRKKIESWREETSTKISVRFWKNSGIVPTSETTVINNSVVMPE
jgi:hypothetical protein